MAEDTEAGELATPAPFEESPTRIKDWRDEYRAGFADAHSPIDGVIMCAIDCPHCNERRTIVRESAYVIDPAKAFVEFLAHLRHHEPVYWPTHAWSCVIQIQFAPHPPAADPRTSHDRPLSPSEPE